MGKVGDPWTVAVTGGPVGETGEDGMPDGLHQQKQVQVSDVHARYPDIRDVVAPCHPACSS